jgi:hypothetical protein
LVVDGQAVIRVDLYKHSTVLLYYRYSTVSDFGGHVK